MAIPDFTFHGKLDAVIAFDPGNNLEINVEQGDTEGERTITITLRDFLTGKVYGYTGSMDVAEEGISYLMLEELEDVAEEGISDLMLDELADDVQMIAPDIEMLDELADDVQMIAPDIEMLEPEETVEEMEVESDE